MSSLAPSSGIVAPNNVSGAPLSAWEQQTQSVVDELRVGVNGINETLVMLTQVIHQMHQQVLPPTPAVKTESTSSFDNRGATYQSNVGVNRDLTPHPVISRIMAGIPPSAGAGAGVGVGPAPRSYAASSTSPAPGATNRYAGLSPPGHAAPKINEELDDSDDDDRARRDVKLPLPSKYKGNVGTDPLALRSFIQSVERFLQFRRWNMDKRRTLDFAVALFEGPASQWYETLKDPSINSWNTLKVALKHRFEPDDVEERETFALLRLEFRGDVQSFNHAFDTRQQLAHESIRDNDAVLIFLYRNAMEQSQSPNTAWLCTMLKNAIRTERLVSLNDVKNAALRLEATLKQGRRGAATATVSASSSSSFRGASSSSSAPYRAGGSSRFQRSGTPVRNPQFNSPTRVNNIRGADATDADYNYGTGADDGGGIQLANMDALFENESDYGVDHGGDSLVVPSFHDEEPSSSSGAASGAVSAGSGAGDDQQALVLHAMRAQQKFGSRFSLTPEDLLRCRQNGLCFKCKRPGHMSSACPSADSNTKQQGK